MLLLEELVCFLRAIILMQAIAHSIPLLPCLPPERSMACCIVLSVKTPKITGLLYFKLTCMMPLVVPLHTKSKCLVSP